MIDIDQVFSRQLSSSVIFYNSDEINFRPFAFVVNVKNLHHDHPIELASGYTLRRAQDSEIAYIKEFVKEKLGGVLSTKIWENRPVESGKVPKLPKKLWRYFVIEFADDDPDLDLLETALAVAPSGLEIGFAKIRVDIKGVVRPACLYHVPSLFQSTSALSTAGSHKDDLMESLGEAEGKQINEVFVRMAGHDNKILDLSRVVDLLLELKDLPRFSPLQILGYFAILESVLTHQPNPDDRYESITRRLRINWPCSIKDGDQYSITVHSREQVMKNFGPRCMPTGVRLPMEENLISNLSFLFYRMQMPPMSS